MIQWAVLSQARRASGGGERRSVAEGSRVRQGPQTIDLPPGMLPVFLPLHDLQHLDRGVEAFIQAQLRSPHLQTPVGFGERLLHRGSHSVFYPGFRLARSVTLGS